MITPVPMQILVVDNHSENRQVARWMLNQAFQQTGVLEAESVEQAVELWDSERIDCVVLDSAISEFEAALGQLNNRHEATGIPLILLLSMRDEMQRRIAQERGIEYWLVKETLSAQQVEMIVHKAMEISSLRLMLQEQGRELERLRTAPAPVAPPPTPGIVPDTPAMDAAEEAYVAEPEPTPPTDAARSESGTELVRPKLVTNGFEAVTADEEELAHRIQSDLLPPGSPFVEGFDIAGLSIQAETTGGDYYDYLPMSDGLLTVTIGECSGRGLAPAMLMASLRAYLRVLSSADMEPADVVSRANTLITEDIGDEEFLVTLMLIQIDQLTRTVKYSSAGHQAHLITRDGTTAVLPSTGMPMGLQPETVIPDGTPQKMRPGDLLLLTTDGVQKMANESGEQFGTERMLEVVRENREMPSRIIVNYLRKACTEFADPQPQGDDVTIVIIRASTD